jgi:hypothetical protein
VYLRSRGHACHDQITALIQSWKEQETAALREYHKKRDTEANAISILEISPILLRDFWDAGPLGEYSFEASLLRTVDWCNIRGFEQWWQRLVRVSQEGVLAGGIEDPAVAAYWLFNMLRSDYAIELMPRTLEQYLERISFPSMNKPLPWIVPGNHGADPFAQHVSYASAMVFAHRRLTSANVEPVLAQQAIDMICKSEDHGAWPISTDDASTSIESTAMAVHALALAQPRGWQRIANNARDWLWSVQQQEGEWSEPGTPGPAYLTVLVLDAIALTNGETPLTFRWPFAQLAQQSGVAAVAKPNSPQADMSTAVGRRAAVDAYIREVLDKTGKRITRTDIWKKAGYRSRTEFERWERADPRLNRTAPKNFTRVLTEKPHLQK